MTLVVYFPAARCICTSCKVCFARHIACCMCVYSRLDYDFLPDHKYEFSVIATDGGSPPLTATAVVQVEFLF